MVVKPETNKKDDWVTKLWSVGTAAAETWGIQFQLSSHMQPVFYGWNDGGNYRISFIC
jgi:hypothetical protein